MFHHSTVLFIVYLQCVFKSSDGIDFTNIAIVIVSQSDWYNAGLADELKRNLVDQILPIYRQNKDPQQPQVYITHQDFSVAQSWTISPIFPSLVAKLNGSDVRWVVFFQPQTTVNCKRLAIVIAAADRNLDVKWIGYPLKYTNIVYPNFATGFAMRLDLIRKITADQEKTSDSIVFQLLETRNTALDLARLVYALDDGHGPSLTAEPSFCSTRIVNSTNDCASNPMPFNVCNASIPEETTIFFAVKTSHNRTETVKQTWGKHVTYIMFYRDRADPNIPSADDEMNPGQCARTISILKMAYEKVKNMNHIQWILLASDNTVLGIRRLCEVLSCYRGGSNIMMIGQRHGYVLNMRTRSKHFVIEPHDFIALGGGEVFSVGAAAVMSQCGCQSIHADGEVALGMCAHRLHLPLTHSSFFHEEEPDHYPREVLDQDRPVSFQCETRNAEVYYKWFKNEPQSLPKSKNYSYLPSLI